MSARIIMKLRVAAAERITPDVLHLRLVHPLRPALPRWTAGAHVDLRLPDGRIRQYSLCGDPTETGHYDIAVKLDEGGRGGSAWVHETLRPGQTAHVSAPRNNFPLAEDATHHILVAGGIGVTPFAAMAQTLAASGASFGLHLCARSAEAAPLHRQLSAICGDRLRSWFSATGPRFSADRLGPPRDGTHIYLCGPQNLVDDSEAHLLAAGWPEDRLHVERFAALLDDNFKPEPFDAVIRSTGAVVHVPADRSLLDMLREAGHDMPSSCELGVCGACECGYSSGTVLHRDVVLSSTRRQQRLMPCVSRARVSVTLDL